MRQFIRHPANIPIQVTAHGAGERPVPREEPAALDVSVGGLAFQFLWPLEPGSLITLRIPLVHPAFETLARVAWCRPQAPGYILGAEFLEVADRFRARMVEQVCHIENYKRHVFKMERRPLSSEEAAREWIAKYAGQFPGSIADDLQ